MNLRILTGSLLLVAFSVTVKAQNDFFYNHYMLNPSYYNPAWVGVEQQAFAAGHLRSQWLGYASSFDGNGGAPSSQMVSVVVPVDGRISGVGLAVSNDRVAELTNLQARFSASIQRDFRFGQLSFGIMPTLFSQSLDFGQFRPVEPEPGLPTGRESQARFDLSAGLYFQSNRNYFLGFSAVNILEPSFDYGATLSAGSDLQSAVSTNYLIMGGTTLGVSRDFVVKLWFWICGFPEVVVREGSTV